MLTSNNRRLLSLTLGVGVAAAAGTVPAAAAAGGDLQSVNPGFTLYRGTFTTFEAAESGVEILAGGVNDRGEISGDNGRISGNFLNPGRAPLLAAGSAMATPTVGITPRTPRARLGREPSR